MNGKKLLALSLAGVMSLGLLAGCGGDSFLSRGALVPRRR